jgi:para-nitrobenzyl esterase
MHHVALLALAVAGSSDSQVYDVRNTTKGEVQGLLNETSSCRSWRGVFFAADAGGSNRWLAPQPRASWAPHVADATAFGAGCLQIHHNPDVPTNQSEDCLNLNVFAPDYCVGGDLAACALPVLIWYHGGTFTEGWSEGPFDLYDGCNLAHGGDVIVVTANYRLGAMGFLVTKGEGGEGGEYALRGNQGMRDQKAAMEWVRDNIANFGGDPGRVTIFGQSAGSMSVGLHHTSPEMYESGLFKRVIMVRQDA